MRRLVHALSTSALTFNGSLLDYEIDGFMTVNVEGRQLFSPKIETKDISGRDGDFIFSSKYPARKIVVHFLMEESRNAFFLEKIKRLTDILQTDKDVPFSFADEEGYRMGRLSDYEDPPFDSNKGFGKFTIHCQNPFLYRNKRTIKDGKIPRVEFRKYPLKLNSIRIKCKEAQKLIIKNESTGRRIILNGEFKDGQDLIFTKEEITLNGQNIISWLDFIASDYQAFQLFSENQITTSPKMEMILDVEEKVL